MLYDGITESLYKTVLRGSVRYIPPSFRAMVFIVILLPKLAFQPYDHNVD